MPHAILFFELRYVTVPKIALASEYIMIKCFKPFATNRSLQESKGNNSRPANSHSSAMSLTIFFISHGLIYDEAPNAISRVFGKNLSEMK